MKKTLYEMLGVDPQASPARIQAAYRLQLTELEARDDLTLAARQDQRQLLRMAFGTLSDPVSRHAYDTRLEAERTGASATHALTLRPEAEEAAAHEAQAEAAALRAEALALRAEALALKTSVAPAAPDPGVGGLIASGLLLGLKRFTRAIGLLVLVGFVTFGVTRGLRGDPAARQADNERRALEQAALREYEQTHGVRPANLADLERMESDRRKREIEARQGEFDREKQEREARRFEEESLQRGRDVAAELQQSEEHARMLREQERERQLQDRQMRAEAERARAEADQARAERERNQWREVLNR